MQITMNKLYGDKLISLKLRTGKGISSLIYTAIDLLEEQQRLQGVTTNAKEETRATN